MGQRLLEGALCRTTQAGVAVVPSVGGSSQRCELVAQRRVEDHQRLGEVESAGQVESSACRGGDDQPGFRCHGVVVGQHPEMDLQVPAAPGSGMRGGRSRGVYRPVGHTVAGQQREVQSERCGCMAGHESWRGNLLCLRAEHVQGDWVVGKRVAGDVHPTAQPGDAPGTNRGLDAPLRHPLGGDVCTCERDRRGCPRVGGAHGVTLAQPAPDAQRFTGNCGWAVWPGRPDPTCDRQSGAHRVRARTPRSGKARGVPRARARTPRRRPECHCQARHRTPHPTPVPLSNEHTRGHSAACSPNRARWTPIGPTALGEPTPTAHGRHRLRPASRRYRCRSGAVPGEPGCAGLYRCPSCAVRGLLRAPPVGLLRAPQASLPARQRVRPHPRRAQPTSAPTPHPSRRSAPADAAPRRRRTQPTPRPGRRSARPRRILT